MSKKAYTVRQAVTEAVTAMRQDLPRSEKTWAPYLQLLVDGLPDMCPCSCPACAVGPCPCPGGIDGRVVRVRDGAATVEKEPAAPAANTVAGYYVIEAADIDAACELAARLPIAAYGYVEVRQVVEFG